MGVFVFQAEDGIRDLYVTGVQTCALPISDERRTRFAGQHPAGPAMPWRCDCAGHLSDPAAVHIRPIWVSSLSETGPEHAPETKPRRAPGARRADPPYSVP